MDECPLFKRDMDFLSIARDPHVLGGGVKNDAFYFHGLKGVDLVTAVKEWLTLDAERTTPSSEGLK